MSLSSLIEGDQFLRNEIRGAFQLSELRLKFERTRPLLAPPNTTNSRLVGVAFDYLLRFYLEKLNGLPYDRENLWIAERARNILLHSYKISTHFECPDEYLKEESINTDPSSPELKLALHLSNHYPESVLRSAYDHSDEIIRKVKSLRKKFAETSRLSRELIRQTLRMSYVDPVLRSGRGIEYIGKDADQLDIEDIEQQFSLIDDKLF